MSGTDLPPERPPLEGESQRCEEESAPGELGGSPASSWGVGHTRQELVVRPGSSGDAGFGSSRRSSCCWEEQRNNP